MTGALAELQHWMQDAILAGTAEEVRTHVHGNNRLAAEARLGIYAQGYRLRLIECLRTEYPALLALAGPTAFDLFAEGYIAAYPSHSYTLYDFGADFADYLERARPADGGAQSAEAIPAALARIERARAEILRAHGVERLAMAAAPDEDPLLAALFGLDRRRYRRPDSVRLLELPFDFTETLAAAGRGEMPPFPQPVATRVAVTRANYRAECHGLTDWQYDWLAALREDIAMPLPPGDARLAAWLPIALVRGFVVAEVG